MVSLSQMKILREISFWIIILCILNWVISYIFGWNLLMPLALMGMSGIIIWKAIYVLAGLSVLFLLFSYKYPCFKGSKCCGNYKCCKDCPDYDKCNCECKCEVEKPIDIPTQ